VLIRSTEGGSRKCSRFIFTTHEIEPGTFVGSRVGISLLVLGLMHFFNMVMIARFGRAVKAWAQDQAADV